MITIVVSASGSTTVTKDVVINLRGSANDGECDVRVIRNNQVVFNQTVPMGTITITIPNQKGSGPQKYEVVIDDLDGFDHWEEFS
jgi:type 1 fimbria pilin